jgi:hypothetical protein
MSQLSVGGMSQTASLSGYGISPINVSQISGLDMMSNDVRIDIRDGMNITVARASNGWVVQLRVRNHSDHSLHIITDEGDFGAELGKIITMACLKETV